jgi:hypothetical protein
MIIFECNNVVILSLIIFCLNWNQHVNLGLSTSCIYKWITKTLTIRLEKVVGRLIHKNQAAFLCRGGIKINVLALYEILHETRQRGEVGVVVKLDFEKAYDMVDWDFLIKCLVTRGFSGVWCACICKVLKKGTVAIRLNEQLGSCFQSHKGGGGEARGPIVPYPIQFCSWLSHQNGGESSTKPFEYSACDSPDS